MAAGLGSTLSAGEPASTDAELPAADVDGAVVGAEVGGGRQIDGELGAGTTVTWAPSAVGPTAMTTAPARKWATTGRRSHRPLSCARSRRPSPIGWPRACLRCR